MRLRMLATLIAVCAVPLAPLRPAVAADVALVLVNGDYDNAPDIRQAGLAQSARLSLEEAGYRVFLGQDVPGGQMQSLAGEVATALEEDWQNRLVIVLAGHMVRSGDQPYLLGRDAMRPTNLTVGAQGVPVAALAELAGRAQGQTVVLLADSPDRIETGAGLVPGAGEVTAPQGVTLLRGPLGDLLTVLRDDLLVSGVSYAAVADRAPRRVTASGFLSASFGLMPGDGAALPLPGGAPRPDTPDPAAPEPALPETDTGELAYWAAVQDIGTLDAYEAYVGRYPQGAFTDEARQRAVALRDLPRQRADAEEQALGLDRDDRRQIQRDLALLGHDPRGIDGIFGPATRAAIIDRQKQTGVEPTGFLTGAQLDRLAEDAQARARKLEEEAARRRSEQEAKDRAYWDDVGRGKGAEGLRAYLERYPDGLYADVAQERLDRYEDDRRQQAAEIERRAWDATRAEDTIPAYQEFLRMFPGGVFAADAQARISQLDRDSGPDIDAAQAEEDRVLPNNIARLLVEKRLQQLGNYPGLPDGDFTPETRRALRRFQRDQGLPVTGYATQDTVVRLLAGAR